MKSSTARRAFTLIELLVVIGIIAVLIGILLPAVQKVREAAARSRCANNLKQMGLALQAYHDSQGSYPPGYDSGYDAAGNDTGPGWGWAARILPFVEQQSLYTLINFQQPIEAPGHSAARTTSVKLYLCPSSQTPSTFAAARRTPTGQVVATLCDVAASNYPGVFGITEPGVDGEGMFFRGSQVRIPDITDGTSHTLIVGERAYLDGETTWVGAVTGANMVAPPASPMPQQVLHSSNNVLGHSGEATDGPDLPQEPNHFSSRHPGGVNFLFVDGHVSFLGRSVSYSTYKALSTRAAGDLVPGDF
ncbi:MAG: DUF1559 domain-containing protein [Gemmataceae bacterium]